MIEQCCPYATDACCGTGKSEGYWEPNINERPDGRDKRPGLFRFRAAGLNFRQLCQTGQLRINGRAIVLQHDRENNGVCQTVRRIIQPAQRVRDAMDIPHTRACEGQARRAGGVQHLLARFHVIGGVVRALQIPEDGNDRILTHLLVLSVLYIQVTYDSTACVSASTPVVAVMNGGMLTVSSGSRIAAFGVTQGAVMAYL